nr:hypothetical protein [Tanacetum cinerariifolium]
MSDMTVLLNDFSYIPPNNKHNEPTQGDIGETSNEPTQATRNEFEEFYASANEELYPGCDYVTRLDFMEKFTYFTVKGKLTDSIFNEMLEFFQNVFPISKGYKLPPSYYATKKTFKTIGLGYESIHACEHDCCLFRGKENKDLDFCPVCNTSRWKYSNTPGKKVPKKVLRYFLIIPRLQRLYKSSHTAKEMIWHATGKYTEPSKMQHPVDGRAWKKFDTMYSDFAKELRNVRLGLAADGFNPFGNLSQAYNMWPVILTTYNLPPWLCMKESFFMLTLLITGPKSPGKDIYVYLRPLIEDLEVLWDRKGVKTIDVASGQKFDMRAMVLWTINDFPAQSSLSGWSGQGYKACPTYHKDTPFVRVLSKTACGLQQYLPDKIAKPIIELCSLFKQICSATLMEDDMLKAQIKVVDILCDLELIYHPALFDIMIHLVIHLPLEDLEGGPIRPQWMFPFERYMKKLKGYVRNKAKPEDNDKDTEVSTTSELFALACRPTWTPISVNSCVVDGVSLNDLDNATLYIDGQSTEVDAPPDIIDVPDEDDDIIDDEDALPHDLVDFDDEDLINVDDDGVDKMSVDVARSHGGNGGGVDRPLPHHVPIGCEGCFVNRGKGKRKPNLVCKTAGRLHTRNKTRNLLLKEITDKKGPYIGEVIMGVSLYYPSWLKVSKARKATLITDIGTQFDLRPHMESPDWTEIDADIQQHLQKSYNTNKAAFKAQHWVIDPEIETYNVEKIKQARPEGITMKEWDNYMSHPQTGPGWNTCPEA